MASTIRRRPDQVAELTRGLRLPLPEIEAVHLEVIAETLFQAYIDISATYSPTVRAGDEAEVTALMESRLTSMINQNQLWGQLVRCVVRGKESLSYDGSHLEKRPDLSLYLSHRHQGFPLVAEAKVIDAPNSKTEKLYCEKGISRYVKGEYAWGNREAFMIAYVRDGSSIGSKLTPHLSREKSRRPPKYLVEDLPIAAGSNGADLARSRHGRKFKYLGKPRSKPGSISVWHLWLS